MSHMDVTLFLALGALLALLLAVWPRFWALLLTIAYWFIPFLSASNFLPNFNSKSFVWSKSLGIMLQFHWDGLTDLFILLISGIGILIFYYAYYYSKPDQRPKLLCLLQLFAVSMFGLVLADDLILLFVFWELTSICSFFLIQFNTYEPKANSAAVTGLLITVMGSLIMLVGFIMLGSDLHSFQLSHLIEQSVLPAHAELVFAFIMMGILTKSAQFPFYFWLPGAMKAPTPVSAYLHSATMVNAGIYLLARLHPLFSQMDIWYPSLAFFGLMTMTVSALLSLFQSDLKALLAYTTTFALGAMVYLLASTAYSAIEAFCIFLLFHGLYKAGAFMLVGNIDKSFGTRDLLKLGGALRHHQAQQIGFFILFGAMAGLPPFFGFSVKEMIYEAKLAKESISWLVMGLSIVSSMIIAASSLHAVWVLLKPVPEIHPKNNLTRQAWSSVTILATMIVFLSGLDLFVKQLVQSGIQSILPTQDMRYLTINTPMSYLLSMATVAGGLILSFVFLYTAFIAAHWPNQISPKHVFEFLFKRILSAGKKITISTQGASEQSHLLIIIATLATLFWLAFAYFYNSMAIWSFNGDVGDIALFFILSISALSLLFTHNKLYNLVSLSVIGLAVACFFMLQGAIDVAITQLLIEILTIVILLLVFASIRQATALQKTTHGLLNYFVALAFGSAVSVSLLAYKALPWNRFLQDYYDQHSFQTALGKNIVNVILVDFRAFDTLGEVLVVLATAVAITLLNRRKTHVDTTKGA